MSTVVSVWSKVLLPGQDSLVSEDVTIQITNITLEVDDSVAEPAANARSVVKMQHLEADPRLLAMAANYDIGSDSDYDSDEDEDDSDLELDEDEAEDQANLSKASKASSSSKVNGKTAEEDVDADEDDDDEDDEEDDFDFDLEREEQEVQLCSLLPGKIEQVQTNIVLPGGDDFVFKLSGNFKVHLLGHYVVQPSPSGANDYDRPPYDSDEDDEITSDEELDSDEMGMYDPETGLALYDDSEDEASDEEEDEEEDSRFMEIEEAKSPKKAAKDLPKKADAAPAAPTAADAADKTKLSKNQLKKQAKKEKAAAVPAAAEPSKTAPGAAPAASAAKADEAVKPAKKAPNKKQTLPSGLVIEDNKVGTGPAAKAGQRVQMRYIGRLQNGKIFDQNTKGAPFAFKLGKQEVIKGWDEGIAGMQVGGERKLVIPPQLAYGKQGVSGIPPNSTLTFEVKLLSIK